jgi:protein-disulfide isomerase
VFSNLACGSCGDTADVVRRLRAAWPGRVREVWRSFVPPYASSGAVDVMGAELAAAADRQDRFWALHDLLFGIGRAPMPRRSRVELELAAQTAGVDLARRDTAAERLQLERDQAEARRLNIPYAPALLINGVLHAGPVSFERLDQAVRSEMSRGFLDRLSP